MLDVIIPSYNDDRIFRTISSLKSSSYFDHMRLIIIDGGSSSELANEIGKNIRSSDKLLSEPDKGIFDALNKGLDHCENEFIYWLGSDDFINPDFDFEGIIEKLKDSSCVGAVGRTFYFNEEKVTRPLYYKQYTLSSYRNGAHIPHFSSIWKRDFIGTDRFNLEFKISADYDFFFLLFERIGDQKVIAVDDTMVYMQEGGNSSKDVKRQLEGANQLLSIHRLHTSFLHGYYFLFMRYFLKLKLKFFGRPNSSPIINHLSKVNHRA